jgi:hypothetical protein
VSTSKRPTAGKGPKGQSRDKKPWLASISPTFPPTVFSSSLLSTMIPTIDDNKSKVNHNHMMTSKQMGSFRGKGKETGLVYRSFNDNQASYSFLLLLL